MKNTLGSYNTRILFWINFFSTISFIKPVLTLFYFERGINETELVLIIMFWSGAVLIGEVPTGVFADRFGAKLSFLTGSFIRVISVGILIFAHEPWVFFLASALSGLSVTFFSGADEALLYESLKQSNDEEKMDSVMGKIQSATFLTMIVTVLVGSYIAKDLAESQFFMLLIMSMAAQFVVVFLTLFVKEPSKMEYSKEHPFLHVGEGIKVIKKTPQLLWMFLNVSIVFIPAAAIFDNFDQLILTEAGIPVILIGVIYAIAAVLGFFASRSIGWMTKRYSAVMLMHVTGGFAVLSLLAISQFGHSLWVVLVAFLILRFVRAVRYPIYSKLSNEFIPSNVRATTISLLSVLDSVFDLIIMGTVASIAGFGLPTILIVCGFIALVGTLLPIKRATEEKIVEKLSV
ncbi:MFS transporter [Bacillus salitolerans]|uniref:MFS transporter n=1 Tax=Bacillus salitolerans TaxID=1437434 RepID=A0ABW4LKC4_9BACI